MGLQEFKKREKREKVRKQVLTFVTFVLLLGISVGVCAGTYSGGTGEPNDPYRIETPNDLNDIGNHVEDFNKCFVLVNDINLADYNGTQFNIIGDESNPFTGVFDGNGHTISNFTYSSAGQDFIGLFGVVGIMWEATGVVKDLNLTNADVDAGTGDSVGALVGLVKDGDISNCRATGRVSGAENVGGLVGFSWSQGISNCYTAGEVLGDSWVGGLVGIKYSRTLLNCRSVANVKATGNYVGGLVGYTPQAFIESCSAAGNVSGAERVGGLVGDGLWVVNSWSSGSVRGNNKVGGLAGDGWDAQDCYSSGTVTGDTNVGGLVGYNRGDLLNCFASGVVDANTNVGGLVGYDDSSSYTKCFWDSDINPDVNGIGSGDDPNVIGKSTAEMQTESTFTDAGWDFVEVWDMGENQTYPFLRVYPAGDLNHDGRVDFFDVAILASHWLEGK
jgi:hypothetical protein